jgi:flavorubredoxin
MFPNVEILISTIEHMAPKDHYLGVFGNFLWNGGGVKNLMAFAERIKWELVYNPVEEKGALKKDNKEQLIHLADAMADKLLVVKQD